MCSKKDEQKMRKSLTWAANGPLAILSEACSGGENRYLRNQPFRRPMGHHPTHASTCFQTRSSADRSALGAGRYTLYRQGRYSLADAPGGLSSTKHGPHPFPQMDSQPHLGIYQCPPACLDTRAGGQALPPYGGNSRQPERQIRRPRRTGRIRCGQENYRTQAPPGGRYLGFGSRSPW